MGRDGSAHKVCDALVGDETGVIYLTLWDDNIDKVNDGDSIRVENGYVTLFKGNMRLNIGKYGKLEMAKEPLAVEVNTENNVSSKTYEQERRPFRGGRGGFGGRGGGGGGTVEEAAVAAAMVDVIDAAAAVAAAVDTATGTDTEQIPCFLF